jgi:hypothetical protein
MSSHQRNHTAVIRWLLFVCLLYSGSSLEAQIEAPAPVPTTEAPSKSNETSDDSEFKIHNYQLKHAKAAEVLKLFKQLHGGENTATVDERTNSIVFLADETDALELRESLALLDGDALPPIIPPTPVLKGSSPQALAQAKHQTLPATSIPGGPYRKFTFKHAKVADVFKILREVTGLQITNENMEGFVVDEQTNSVIWKVSRDGDEWESRNWEESLLTLDGESSTSKAQKTPSPYRPTDDNRSDGVSLSFQTLTISLEVDRSNTVESLKQGYNKLEQQAHQLADKLKQSKSPSEAERTELQAAVRKSFEARQALQRAELADLAQRMKSMQQSIDMRDKLADKVVQRRVEDLLNPGLKWDAGKVSEQLLVVPNQVSSNPATPLPPSALPSNLSAPYVPGERAETVIRKKIQGRWIVQTLSDGNKDALADLPEQMEVDIDGNSMRYLVGKQDEGRLFLADCKEVLSPTLTENGPLPIDFIHDPNGDPQTIPGIIACDGTTLSICMASDEGRANKDFRPSLFVPGTKVTLLKCHRAEPETAKAVSVDKTTWKSAVQHATSKLLAAFPVPPAIDQNDAPKVIAIVDVDYQGKQEVGNLLEEICKWIAADIPFARVQGNYASLSRSAVKLAMQETGLRPRDLTRSSPYYVDNRLQLLKQLRSQELKVDALLITSLKHLEDVEDAYPSQFEITLEGFIDARTRDWIERVNIDGKAKVQPSELLSKSPPQLDTPQALLARVDECSNNGSYEEFVSLFSDEGVRDLAGSLIVSAMQVTTVTELAKQNGGDLGQGPARIQEALNRWLKPNPTPEQQQAVNEAFSLMFLVGVGGPVQDKSEITAYVAGIRKSAERVTDFRKFSVDMLKAYHELTGEPFGYFSKEKDREWHVTQSADKAVATLVVKTEPTPAPVGIRSNIAEQNSTSNGAEQLPVMTLTKLDGTWRISSLFDELLNVVEPKIEAPSTVAPE